MPCVAHCVVDGAEQALGWAAFFRGAVFTHGACHVFVGSRSQVSRFFFSRRFNSLCALCCSLRFLFLVSKSVKSPIKCEGGGLLLSLCHALSVPISVCGRLCVTENRKKPKTDGTRRKPKTCVPALHQSLYAAMPVATVAKVVAAAAAAAAVWPVASVVVFGFRHFDSPA